MSTKFKKGDIIIFKAEDDWLSKAIAWLTDSDVSHSAMVYSENSIIEVGARGIDINQVDISNGRGAYIMRLQPDMDAAPLIQAADKYYDAKIRYDFPALFLLGGLLIFQKIAPTARLMSITNRILSAACLELDLYIQKTILHREERAMICSQLVYQIFYDCGESYQIQVHQSPKSDFSNANGNTVICLKEMAEALPDGNDFSDAANSPTNSEGTPEDVPAINDDEIEELYLALCESADTDSTANNGMMNAALDLQKSARHARMFLDKVKNLMSLLNSDIPIDAMFVTPADLVYHSDNLKKQGEIGITRVSTPK